MEQFGHFGNESKSYASARRGYPEAVFYYLKIFAKEDEPLLDLGCGTGISTRQIALNGFQDVQGVDSDEDMLYEARQQAIYKHIPYWHASAASMPFRSQFFQVVTCFSSFHWFADSDSIVEIKRVLKKEGHLFICRKEDISPFKEKIRRKIEEKLQIKFPKILTTEQTQAFLLNSRFRLESPKAFAAEDHYSLTEAIDYIKSTSFWAALAEEQKIPMLDTIVIPELTACMEISKKDHDRIIRRYNAVVLVAHKA